MKMFKKLGRFVRSNKLAVAAMVFVSAGPSFAAAGDIDTTTVITAIAAGATAVGAIGAAVAGGPKVVSATYKWVKSAIS